MSIGVPGLPIGLNRGAVDSDALAWAAAVVSNGGTVSAATLTAVSNFCKAAKGAGYWNKLNRINLICGNQLAAALVPLKVGGGSATDTNVNFVGGDYTEATGLTGNGTTKYLNTGLNPSIALTANDTHLAVYSRSSAEIASGATMGCFTAAAAIFSLYAPLGSDGKLYSSQYNGSAPGRVVSAAAISTPFGFCVGSRSASNAHAAYRNAVSLASEASTGGALPNNANFLVFAVHDGASPTAFSSMTISAYSIGSGLSAADVTAYNTHMQAFQTALGRNV